MNKLENSDGILLSTINEPDVKRAIICAAQNTDDLFEFGPFNAHFEHGQWFIICSQSLASWSVVDIEAAEGEPCFGFEIIDPPQD